MNDDRRQPNLRRRGLSALAITAPLFPAGLFAQSWPARPIRIVVPFAPGGTTDLIARLVAVPLARLLSQPVVVENRAGAGGLIGADAVAKAAGDGYTLLMANISFPLAVLTAQRARRLGFDPLADLHGVGVVANVPMVITAPSASGVEDLRGFAERVRSEPDTHFVYGSPGAGSYLHVFGEWFQREIKAPITHVPFKGTAPLKQEMLAGRIHLGGDQLSSSLAEIRSGRLRALAVTSARRSASLPAVPTLRELGFDGVEIEGWNGLLAPAGTPADVLARLRTALSVALRDAAVRQRLEELGAEAADPDAESLDTLLRKQLAQFRPMVATLDLE